MTDLQARTVRDVEQSYNPHLTVTICGCGKVGKIVKVKDGNELIKKIENFEEWLCKTQPCMVK